MWDGVAWCGVVVGVCCSTFKQKPERMGLFLPLLCLGSSLPCVSSLMCRAAIYGETDWVAGVSENIMLGQLAPVGTGAFSLLLNDLMLEDAIEVQYGAAFDAPDYTGGMTPSRMTPMHSPHMTPGHTGSHMMSPSSMSPFHGGSAAFSPMVGPGGFSPMVGGASPGDLLKPLVPLLVGDNNKRVRSRCVLTRVSPVVPPFCRLLSHFPSVQPHEPGLLADLPSLLTYLPSLLPDLPSLLTYLPSLLPNIPSLLPHIS